MATGSERRAFELIQVDGFNENKAESIAVSHSGERVFCGSSEGAINVFGCRPDTKDVSGQGTYAASKADAVRTSPKDKKPVQQIQAVEGWRALIAIVDGCIQAYDPNTYRTMAALSETKGVTLFAVHERSNLLCAVTKRKVSTFGWQGQGFVALKEFTFPETPRGIACSDTSIMLGFRNSYSLLDMQSGREEKVIDTDRESRPPICLFLPATQSRKAVFMIANGTTGLLFDPQVGLLPERLVWSAPPSIAHVSMPFLVTLFNDKAEIHDVGSLQCIQTVEIASPKFVCSCDLGRGIGRYVYVLTGAGKLVAFKMIPLATQVEDLMRYDRYLEALDICKNASDPQLLMDVDVTKIHERHAHFLMERKEAVQALDQYILAETAPLEVIVKLPEFIPKAYPLPELAHLSDTQPYRPGSVAQVAQALAKYCEHHRPKFKELADRVESYRAGEEVKGDYDPSVYQNGDHTIQLAQLIDTVLMMSYLRCNPPNKDAMVALLKTRNRCHVSSVSAEFATYGQNFTEPHLWLYRSHGDHASVLKMLIESCQIGPSGWGRDQWNTWMAEYLRSLWNDPDTQHHKLVRDKISHLIDSDPQLGISVLVPPPASSKNSTAHRVLFVGRGVSVQEMVETLENINPKSRGSDVQRTRRSGRTLSPPPSGVTIPLTTGRALAITYLEYVVYSGNAPASLHNDYALLLLRDFPEGRPIPADLVVHDTDSEEAQMIKLCRQKLQHFLATSTDYQPDVLLKATPRALVHENALILSRLHRHESVLQIYVHQLRDRQLAESYCDKVWTKSCASDSAEYSDPHAAGSGRNVYLYYMRVLLTMDPAEDDASGDQPDKISTVIEVANRFFDRVDAALVMDLLPEDTPLQLLAPYLTTMLRHNATKQKNLQVVHQLLRVQEVKLRTEYWSRQDHN